MNYFFDTEFIEDGKTIDLISIGIVCEDGRELYRENANCDFSKACPWVKENVFPHLSGVEGPFWQPKHLIAKDILAFVNKHSNPRFWSYFADYDWVVFCQLYGRMVDLPAGWPMLAYDIRQHATMANVSIKPDKSKYQSHNALDDARWHRDYYNLIEEIK